MHLRSYLFHLRARNLSPQTIKATEEYLRLFLKQHDPLITYFQQEVATTGLVLHPDGGDLYPVRFIHNRTIKAALNLRPGEIIEVTQGRFKEAFGTKKMELLVKRFHYPWSEPPV